MMRKSYLIGGLVLLLVALAGGWYLLSPGWTLKAMVDAAEAGDEARFSSYVDYPALRQDLRTEMTARLESEAKRDGSAEAQIGLAMGKAIMGPLVDRMVSPTGMRTTFAALAAAEKAGVKGGKAEGKRPDPQIERLGLDRFRVSGKDNPGAGFVFERRGLGWKLVGVDLAASGAPAQPQP